MHSAQMTAASRQDVLQCEPVKRRASVSDKCLNRRLTADPPPHTHTRGFRDFILYSTVAEHVSFFSVVLHQETRFLQVLKQSENVLRSSDCPANYKWNLMV